MKQALNIVWLKRDLRTRDHAPLAAAEAAGLPYLIVYLLEPLVTGYPDFAERHRWFITGSVQQMNEALKPFNRSVWLVEFDALPFFQWAVAQYAVQNIWSYQESGTALTYKRDRTLKKFFRTHQINWTEFQRDGIIRGIQNRVGWDAAWFKTMQEPQIENNFTTTTLEISNPFPVTATNDKQDKHEFQPAGEAAAWAYLNSFAKKRHIHYQ